MSDSKMDKSASKPAKREPRATTLALRANILAGALRCFEEHGIEGTTVSDIRRITNCSIGSLYHHFGSKEGIAEELFIEGIRAFNNGMISQLKRTKRAEDSVKGVVRFYCEWTAKNRPLAHYLHSRNIEFSDDARLKLRDIHSAYITEVFGLFVRYVEAGELRLLPLETYVPLISGPVQEFTRRWLSGQSEEGTSISSQLREIFADAAWKAVRTSAQDKTTH
jgi:AcrR family transcriptional regulator